MNWRTFRLAGLIVVVATGLLVLLFVFKPFASRLTVKVYFKDAGGLRIGAPVRLAGVDVGSVKSVVPRPEAKEGPVEVVMALATAHELRIPDDSTAVLSTAGVLGETYINIDASRASGPPLQDNAILKAIQPTQMSMQEIFEKFGQALNRNCDIEKLTELLEKKCSCDKVSDAPEPPKKLSRNSPH